MQLPFVGTDLGGRTGISLGPSQRGIHRDPVLPVRVRASGGGAVLLGPWQVRALVVLPRSHPLLKHGPAHAARWFGEVHRAVLAGQGIEGTCYAGPTRGHWACFAGQAAGEVLVDGRKIVGVAQTWRRRRAMLWSATLIDVPPWLLMCATLRRPLDESHVLEAVTVSASECLARRQDARSWALTLQAALQGALASTATPPG